ncbi:hypothetical protein [Aquiflexum gelatinilyticum]|uniref:hypothetical protein n=1 Tax=Aquiflexum gelatinilyticum TaxID=2961943 RepID=UPI00216890AA|nr:hypothetical protein [Aquiflexum gelatinilyticum]MCS4436230.1 hypothetical protein [Aquiflexum gelatinilyticum]
MMSAYPDFPLVQDGLAQTDIELDLMVSQNSIPSKKSLGGALPFVFKKGELHKKAMCKKCIFQILINWLSFTIWMSSFLLVTV